MERSRAMKIHGPRDARYSSSTGATTLIVSATARSRLAIVDSEYGKDVYLEAPSACDAPTTR